MTVIARVTKRTILSSAQRVFDPIGFTCPVSLLPKLILQELWAVNLKWDDEVETDIAKRFLCWYQELPQMFCVEIPRWVFGRESNFSLHVFTDASKDAYAAAIFGRVEEEGRVQVNLIAAKSRVAPLKPITIPRLELLGALIGARLFKMVVKALDISQIETYFWSDSSTVIAWIERQEPWTVFVKNRVEEIRNLTTPRRWRHVPGSKNPADLPSRGCTVSQLAVSKWWEGPSWLKESAEQWPHASHTMNELEVLEERRKTPTVQTTVCVDKSTSWYYYKFSRFNKIRRLVGWVRRFIHNCRRPRQKLAGELTSLESEQAEVFIWRWVQGEAFSGIKDERITHLRPFIDEEGVIRLKTRVTERDGAPHEFVCPVLLPKNHVVVHRFLWETHVKNLHVGAQGLLAILRSGYWLLGGRRTAKSVVISRCIPCQRFAAKAAKVSEAALPKERVKDAKPFEVVGIDLCGPLFLRGGHKSWVCLFTCAVVRALHLELIDSLSTESFLLALRRFISRRGRPKLILCDNGTNFKGAYNLLEGLDWDQVLIFGHAEKIEWKFSPPTAPWWGGFWERLVRSVKELLRRSLQRASLTWQEMSTTLCECEAVINSRPLTYLSEDVDDLEALTPAHFYKDSCKGETADLDAVDATSLRRGLRYRLALQQRIWKRFVIEYLGNLRPAHKVKREREVRVGELVLVGNDKQKRLNWPLARVLETFPGKDKRTRVARVKTQLGDFLRPTARLYPLEMDAPYLPESEALPAVTTTREDIAKARRDRASDGDLTCDFETAHSAKIPTNEELVRGLEKAHPVKTTSKGRTVRAPSKLDL